MGAFLSNNRAVGAPFSKPQFPEGVPTEVTGAWALSDHFPTQKACPKNIPRTQSATWAGFVVDYQAAQ